jgi:uncharacterized protein YjbI with pentapeptide repeats
MPSPRNRLTAAPLVDFRAPQALTTIDATALLPREDHEGELLADADLSGRDLTGSSFLECELSRLTLTDAQLRGARFVDSLVDAPFAPVLLAARTTWRNCRIENPRWGSAELFDATLDSVELSGGKIDYLNLRNSTLTNVRIENCTITELDLGGFRGTRIALVNCRIETLDVTRANCTDVDLRTSEFSRVNGIDGLRNATIDDQQLSLFAPAFAGHLGIRVE